MLDLAALRELYNKWLRFRLVEPIRYGADLAKVALARPRHTFVKVLLLSDDKAYTSEQQFAPLLANRRCFRRKGGVIFCHQLLSDGLLERRQVFQQFDIVGLKLGFRRPAAEALSVARAIKQSLALSAKLIYFDGDDDVGVLWPQLLPTVDLYIKKHCFRDRSEYRKKRVGKSNLTDYVSRTYGTSFTSDIIPTSDPVDENQIGKILPGWNVGLDDKIRRLYSTRRALPISSTKDIDIVCRATANPESWMYPLRATVIPVIKSLEHDYRVLTPEQHVTQDVYYEEMLRSKICISPFGYGEICWRDFEAVLCGCVLIKPDMSHVETEPDVFIPHETYVPVRWDFVDLPATLRRLLAHPEECERLRTNAFNVLRNYYEDNVILHRFQQIMRSLTSVNTAA